MASMFLFLGGCQKEEAPNIGLSKKIENRIVQTEIVPNNVKFDINEKWYNYDYKYRANLYKLYGDFDYSFCSELQTGSDQEIYTIPMQKDGILTGIMLYFRDNSKDITYFDFFTIEKLKSTNIDQWASMYREGILEFIIKQSLYYQSIYGNPLSGALANKLIELAGIKSNKDDNRCGTTVFVYFTTVTYEYDNTQNGDAQGGTVTATGPGYDIEVINVPCHNLNLTGTNVTFPIIESGGNGNSSGSGSMTSQEFQECKNKYISAVFDGFIDEILEDYKLVCVPIDEQEQELERLKNEAYANWCRKQSELVDKNNIKWPDFTFYFDKLLDGVDHVTQKELDDHKEIFEVLGITSEADKLKFLSGDDCGDDNGGKCKNCSVGESGIVFLDHSRAREMLDCAINKLNTYDGSDPIISAALSSHFNTNSTSAADFIKTLCKWIKFQSVDTQFESDIDCGGTTLAWSYPAIQFSNIHLCNPNYWNVQNDQERSAIMIHEMFHLYYVAGDWAYIWENKYSGLNPFQHLTNSDSFSEFINSICL